MSIRYDLDPLSALELFYDGEHHGVYKGDFIKNEKKNGLILPPLLRDFLEKFGYLSVNKGGANSYRIFHPDDMARFSLPSGEGEIRLIVIGSLRVDKRGGGGEDLYFIAVRPDTADLQTAMGQESDDGMEWWGTNRTLSSLLQMMFLAVLGKSGDSYIYEESAEIGAVLKNHGAERSLIRYRDDWASVHFDEDNKSFLVTEFDAESGGITCLRVVPRRKCGEEKAEDLTSLTLDELEEIFAAEFYKNAPDCDFEHALEIQTEIIKRLEADGTDETEMLGRYKLCGRCLWALGRLDEADARYAKVLEIAERRASEDPGALADAYNTLGNYYTDVGRVGEGEGMFEKELSLRREISPDDRYHIGSIYADMARRMEGDDKRLDRIIELCSLALEEFNKDPHDSGCKYEIARMQQIRGNARRRKKELDKLNS